MVMATIEEFMKHTTKRLIPALSVAFFVLAAACVNVFGVEASGFDEVSTGKLTLHAEADGLSAGQVTINIK